MLPVNHGHVLRVQLAENRTQHAPIDIHHVTGGRGYENNVDPYVDRRVELCMLSVGMEKGGTSECLLSNGPLVVRPQA